MTTRLCRRTLALAAFLAASPAFALNHESIVAPIAAGPYTVACSNIEQDLALIAALGGTPADFWEGRAVDEQPRYITQILSHPQTAIRFDALVPDLREIYPNTAATRVAFVAVVCHPTPSANADAPYELPGGVGVVPRMQPAGTAPKLISFDEWITTSGGVPSGTTGPAEARLPLIVYSHGLGGSPIGKGYIDVMVALASHGYMVAAVFHGDSRFSRLRVENLSDFWYLVTQYDRVAEMQLMRPVALKAMTDVLLAHPGFSPGIDTDRIGGFGASLGGQAMAHLLGAKMTTSVGLACRETVRDPRIKAAVGFVTYAGQAFLPTFCDGQSGADEVSRPFLALSGTADTTAPITMVRQAINRFRGSRYLVELVDGQHELRAEDVGDLFTWMVTFFGAYLEDDAAAMARFIRMRGVVGGRDDTLEIDVHVPSSVSPGEVRVTELHNNLLDRYFLSPDSAEVASILQGSAGPGWSLTGHAFEAWSEMPTPAFSSCHFPGTVLASNGEIYRECGWAKRLGRWVYDDAGGFFIERADANGRCRDGLLQVNRLYHPRFALNRITPNQRFITSDSAAKEMIASGWILLPATMCARP